MNKGLAFALLLLAAVVQQSHTALEELEALRQQAAAARKAGNKQDHLAAVLKLRSLLNDAPDAIEAAARAYAAVGDTSQALTALNQFAEMGQADDDLLHGKEKGFSALRNAPQYQSILARFVDNLKPVNRSESAFTLPDAGLLPEDIDFDPRSRSFLITSVLEKKIIRLSPDRKAMDFASSPSHWPMFAIKVDPPRRRVWATEVAPDGFTSAPKADWGRSAVLCFDLQTGVLKNRIEARSHTSLGDMTLTRAGDPIVSDGEGGGVYQVIENRVELLNGSDFISPQTPAMLPDDKHVLVPDYARGIASLDLKTKRVKWFNSGGAAKFALNGIDGMYFAGGQLLLTQNGTSPERVVRLAMDPTFTRATSEEIIERATPTLGDPTHGVVVNDFLYYIANSGWSALDSHGDVKAGSRLTPARIMRFKLQ